MANRAFKTPVGSPDYEFTRSLRRILIVLMSIVIVVIGMSAQILLPPDTGTTYLVAIIFGICVIGYLPYELLQPILHDIGVMEEGLKSLPQLSHGDVVAFDPKTAKAVILRDQNSLRIDRLDQVGGWRELQRFPVPGLFSNSAPEVVESTLHCYVELLAGAQRLTVARIPIQALKNRVRYHDVVYRIWQLPDR